MTTGSTTLGGLSVLPNYILIDGVQYANGAGQFGSQVTKTWSGTDQSPGSVEPSYDARYITRSRFGKRVFVNQNGFRFSYKPITDYTVLKKRKVRRKNLNIEKHPYSMSSVRFHDEYHQIQSRALTDGHLNATYQGNNPALAIYGSALGSYPVFTANDQIKLVNQLSERIKGSDFDLSVFLGEGHQTLRLIGDTAILLARSYSLLKKGDVVAAARTLGHSVKSVNVTKRATVGSLWLQMIYGWMPLLQDMKAGAEQFAHLTDPSIPFGNRLVVKRLVDFDRELFRENLAGKNSDAFSTTVNQTSRQIIAYLTERPGIWQMSGILDPENVAWELTPASFIVDMFIPFGDYLRARSLATSLVGTFVTTTRSIKHLDGFSGVSNAAGNYRWVPDGLASKRLDTSLVRTVSSSLSVPMPTVKPLSKALSVVHCSNALALLAVSVGNKHALGEKPLRGSTPSQYFNYEAPRMREGEYPFFSF